MKNLLALLLLAAVAWFAYGKYKATTQSEMTQVDALASGAAAPDQSGQFTCDGRTHCSQMRSCAEATYFVQHCPDTKMDGNGDGVPCERQWCN